MQPAQPITTPAATNRITTNTEMHWYVTTLGAPPEARDATASGPTELGSMFNALAATAARSTPTSEEGVVMVREDGPKKFRGTPSPPSFRNQEVLTFARALAPLTS